MIFQSLLLIPIKKLKYHRSNFPTKISNISDISLTSVTIMATSVIFLTEKKIGIVLFLINIPHYICVMKIECYYLSFLNIALITSALLL